MPVRLLFLFVFIHATAVAQPEVQLSRLKKTWHIQQEIKDKKLVFKPFATEIDSNQLKNEIRVLSTNINFSYTEEVEKYVRLFSEQKHAEFELVLGLSKLYFPLFERALALEGVPQEFKYLSLVLSALNTQAASRYGSSGIWMLPYPIAVRYKLHVNDMVDDRNNDLLATRAAAKYLRDLNKQYNDWNLTLAAFTCGQAGVTRAMNRSLPARSNTQAGEKNTLPEIYPFLPDSQRVAIPALAAAMYCVNNAGKLGLSPIVSNPWAVKDTVQTDTVLHFEPISTIMDIHVKELQALNPDLIADRTPAKRDFYLPYKTASKFYALQDSIRFYQDSIYTQPEEIFVKEIPTQPTNLADNKPAAGTEAVYYRIKSGDNLGYIADWYDVGLSSLKAWNGLNSSFIDVGEQLTIYVPKDNLAYYEKIDDLTFEQKRELKSPNGKSTKTDEPKQRDQKSKPKQTNSDIPSNTPYSWHTVKSGESMYLIAKKYPGVSAQNIMDFNGMGSDLRPGQKIKIPKL